MKCMLYSVGRVSTIFLTASPLQLVVYIVWPGESESAVQNNRILQPEGKIEKDVIYEIVEQHEFLDLWATMGTCRPQDSHILVFFEEESDLLVKNLKILFPGQVF